MYKNVIIWGHPLHSHTQSYIHNAFFRAFKSLGFKTYWFNNTEEDAEKASNINNAIYLTEGQVDSLIPIKGDCAYLTHNSSSQRYGDAKRLGYQVATTRNPNLDKMENVAPLTYYDSKNRTLYFAWATDLLPEEFDFDNVLKVPKENKVYWVGTISKNGRFENMSEIMPFQEDCSRNGVEFVHHQGVSLEENIMLVKKSYISPAIVGKWQKEVGYIPCRIFKNISYGELGITNSEEVKKIFGDLIIYEPNTNNMIETVGEERFNKEKIINAMKYVQKNHTYINRVNDMLKVL